MLRSALALTLALHLYSSSALADSPLPGSTEQEIMLHFRGNEGNKLFRYLSEREKTQKLDGHVRVGHTQNLACSQTNSTCFLSVYEKEWIRTVEGNTEVYSFWKAFNNSIFEGTIRRDSSANTMELTLKDLLRPGSNFQSFQKDCKPSDTAEEALKFGSCRFVLNTRNWPLARRESENVVKHSSVQYVEFTGAAARKVYTTVNHQPEPATGPVNASVKIGGDAYCFHVRTETEDTYACQFAGTPFGFDSNISFVSPLFHWHGISLSMEPRYSRHMLSSYSLRWNMTDTNSEVLLKCDPIGDNRNKTCRYWYEDAGFAIDVSTWPIKDNGGGGIAIGF